jgi:hypothetical protein
MAIVINGSGTVTGLAVGGLPDGTVDADTVAADVATQAEIDAKLNLAGGTLTGDLNFGDNVDANFGAGADLKIYHDGSNSYIDDVGTGNLNIKAQNLKLLGSNNDSLLFGQQGGAVTLYHSNAAKLATTSTGVNVSSILKVNRTSTSVATNLQVDHAGASEYGIYINSTSGGSGTAYHMTFNRGDTQAGYLTSSPTSVGLANSSDERLKENIQDSASATQDIKNIKVRQFDWKNNRDVHKDYGFVAQELVTVVPEAVAVGSEELNEDGTPVQIWGVDDSKLIPRLVKTIQELEARITALEA